MPYAYREMTPEEREAVVEMRRLREWPAHSPPHPWLRRPNRRQENFQAFLRLLRRAYPGRVIWLLLDEAPCPVAPKSQALAASLNIELIWLPK